MSLLIQERGCSATILEHAQESSLAAAREREKKIVETNREEWRPRFWLLGHIRGGRRVGTSQRRCPRQGKSSGSVQLHGGSAAAPPAWYAERPLGHRGGSPRGVGPDALGVSVRH